MLNPFTYVSDKFKEVVIENITKKALSYLKNSIIVVRGYRSLYATILLLIQARAQQATNPEEISILDVVLKSLMETGEGLANGDLTTMVDASEITVALNAAYLIYTFLNKVYKAIQGKPQVPYIPVKK